MADLTYAELAGQLTTDSADSLKNIAAAAANVVCGIYRDHPTGIIPSVGSTPVSDVTTALLDRLCAPRGALPPPRTVPFNGGQCNCVRYRVFYEVIVNGGAPSVNPFDCNGPVGTYRRVYSEGSIQLAEFGITHNNDACTAIVRTGAIGNVLPSSSSIRITNIERLDGQPDSCGNPPPEFPRSYPTTNNYNTNVAVSIGGIAINTPITIIPTTFSPEFNFRPEFNIDVGGIDVNFNLGGIDFNFNPTFNTPIRIPGDYPTTTPPPAVEPQEKVPSECDLDPVIELLEDIKDCACEPEDMVLARECCRQCDECGWWSELPGR